MLDRLSKTPKKYANGWLVLVFFGGEMFFNAVLLPNQQVKIEAASAARGRLTCNYSTHPTRCIRWPHPMVKKVVLPIAHSN